MYISTWSTTQDGQSREAVWFSFLNIASIPHQMPKAKGKSYHLALAEIDVYLCTKSVQHYKCLAHVRKNDLSNSHKDTHEGYLLLILRFLLHN